jgi:enoyl-CoA hydratase/carnithine racemase
VTIAEVHGDAAGFGAGLVALADVSVAVASAGFWFPEVGLGLAPTLVLAWLERAVGRREAFWLSATGERISATRAQQLGLLNDVVPDQRALSDVIEQRVGALLPRSPRVHAEIKSMLRAASGLNPEQANELAASRLVVGSLRLGH